MKTKIYLLILSSCIVLLSAGCYKQDHELLRPSMENNQSTVDTILAESYNTPITAGDNKLSVEVVDTDESRKLGLSNRATLLEGNGMLFDFTNTTTTLPSFWMKDMNFDIDIIWINQNKIIGITSDVPAPKNKNISETLLPSYPPPSTITHVLEVPSGWSKKNNLKVGDEIKIGDEANI